MTRNSAGDPPTTSRMALHPKLAGRLALRQLRRAPGSAFYAALTLAIGLGAATAIYSVMKGFEAPLPFPDGEHVVQVKVEDPENGRSTITIADLEAWTGQSQALESAGAFSTFSTAMSSPSRATRLVSGAVMTEEVFALLRVNPRIGRVPTGLPIDENVIVISQRLWQDWMGSPRDVLGTTVRIGGEPHTIIGIMPEGFNFPFQEDFWQVREESDRSWNGVQIAARLSEGVPREKASTELTAILTRNRLAAGAGESTARAEVYGFTEKRGESGETTMLFGLLLMVLALVMVSCSNVSNLLLERAAARARSLAVHQALGAVPAQIVLQIFTEALFIAVLGVLLGLLVAAGAIAFIESMLADHWGYFWMRVELESSAVLFGSLLGVATALVSGTLPAWRVMRTNLTEPLKQESKAGRGGQKPWASWVLMTGQVAFSCVGVIASVLMGLGLLESRQVDEAFPADSVMWTSVTFDGERYDDAAERLGFRSSLLDAIQDQPAVSEAALSTGLPGLRSPTRRITLGGRPLEPHIRSTLVSGVTSNFFNVFNIHILEGRAFLEAETSSDVAVVSEDFVRHRLEGQSPIGRLIDLHAGGDVQSFRIIGVASNVVIYDSDRDRPLDYVYLPIDQDDARQFYLTLRSEGDRSKAAAALARASQNTDPEVPVDEMHSIAEMLAYVRRFMETLGTLAVLGGLGAIVVVTIGLYGLISFDVRRRLPEFALRLALGAGTGRVVTGVLRKGFTLILPGMVLGLGLTYLLTPLLGVFLGAADSHDPRVFGGALAIYGLIALVAAGFPAHRAASCNPADILREE